MTAPMVAASTSTISSLLVSLRSGVGMRTFLAINQSKSSGDGRGGLGGEQRLEITEAGFDLARLTDLANNRVEGLEAVAGDAEHGGIIGGNPPGGNQFLG